MKRTANQNAALDELLKSAAEGGLRFERTKAEALAKEHRWVSKSGWIIVHVHSQEDIK